jgi:hypothetical protein
MQPAVCALFEAAAAGMSLQARPVEGGDTDSKGQCSGTQRAHTASHLHLRQPSLGPGHLPPHLSSHQCDS